MDRLSFFPAAPRRLAAFSLPELLVSLSVVALLAGGLARVSFSGLSARWVSREAATRAMGALRRARWMAVGENRAYGVTFGRSATTGCWESLLQRRQDDRWVPAANPEPLPRGIAALQVSGPSRMQFNPDGTSTSGSLTLTGTDGRLYRITTTAASGRLRLYRPEP